MSDVDTIFFVGTGIILGLGILAGVAVLLANIHVFNAINKRLRASGLSLSWFSYTNRWRVTTLMRQSAPAEFSMAYRLKWLTLVVSVLLALLWLTLVLYTDARKQRELSSIINSLNP